MSCHTLLMMRNIWIVTSMCTQNVSTKSEMFTFKFCLGAETTSNVYLVYMSVFTHYGKSTMDLSCWFIWTTSPPSPRLWVRFLARALSSAFTYLGNPSSWYRAWHRGGTQCCGLSEQSHCWYLHHAVIHLQPSSWYEGIAGRGWCELSSSKWFSLFPRLYLLRIRCYNRHQGMCLEFSGCLVLR